MSKSHTGTVIRCLLGSCIGAFVLTAIACNTVEGAGKDVRSAGNGIADTANSAK
jgi:predicted small secreted protein